MRMMIITTNFISFLQTFLLLLFLILNIHGGHSKFAGNGAKCRKTEQMALLKFKAELIDEHGRLSSWGSTNCCEWKGVVCDNRTNHVVALDLHGPMLVPEVEYRYLTRVPSPAAPLQGQISPSLLQLSHLQYLDLSLNDFNGSTIPNFIGSFSKLHHLIMSYSNFGGLIPHHIGNLSALRLLDLRGNSLTDTNLDWLSGFRSLEYLDLSSAGLEACTTWMQALHKLTALKQLHLSSCNLPTVVEPISVNSSNSLLVLELSYNYDQSYTALLLRFLNMSRSFTYIDFTGNDHDEGTIPNAMANLVSLSYLGLGYTNLNSSNPDVLGNLTSLSYLDLSNNHLEEFELPSRNSSSLRHFDLSYNYLTGQVPHLLTWLPDSTLYISLSDNVLSGSFPNMSRFSLLKELHLGNNLLNGSVLEGNLSLPYLEYLDLSTNKFTGRLPNISSCPSLTVLSLYDNSFNGSFTESFGHLSKIESLYVGYNELEGVITEAHLASLPHLTYLDLSFNLNITLSISPFWVHPVQFRRLQLANCKLGPHFPRWLQKQNQLQNLDISNSKIFDTIPSWFWDNIHVCRYLNMSHNQIYGVLPNLSSTFQYKFITLDFSSNEFTGSLPPLPPSFEKIYLSNSRFSGIFNLYISKYFNFYKFNNYRFLLDLSNNLLSGEIPQDSFMSLLSVRHLNLANNNFTGEIPTTNNLPCRVVSLHLRNNSFSGEIQRSLMNCNALEILDLGANGFSGKIPDWFGESMPRLSVLILKSNMLYGGLPPSLCHLEYLQVLDISSNKIIGTIPNCIYNFTLLSSEIESQTSFYYSEGEIVGSYSYSFYGSASVIWKGYEETYIKTLGLLKMIDLSSNELIGEIPQELTSLIGLLGLNLSRNNLVGFIPHDIDQLKLLNFLDLSRNMLSGGIPPTLAKLSHLGFLNLSFNNLSGRIPWDTHLQTFGDSTYLGNPRLCGPPLLWRPCTEDERPSNGRDDSEEEEKFMMRGFYISMVLGFIAAFWVVFWILFFNKWWNAIVMKIYITVGDWLYVSILVNKRRLLRYLGNA